MNTILSKPGFLRMLKIAFCLATLSFSGKLIGQPLNVSRNGLHFELFGNGGFYSFNYEKAFDQSLHARIGFMYFALPEDDSDEIDGGAMLPIMLNYLYGKSRLKLEIGLGIALVFPRGEWADLGIFDSETNLVGTATIGYRLQPESRGLIFGVAFTPFFGDKGLSPWGGLKIGYSF